ncbi:MAG: hypothetical protein PVF58_10830 [Candidatus Methanofastidiosia archaeon]|jgi:hypothetical protein
MAEKEKDYEMKPDRTDILAFIIAIWQIFIPMILVFLGLFLIALLVLYLI